METEATTTSLNKEKKTVSKKKKQTVYRSTLDITKEILETVDLTAKTNMP